MPRSTTKRKKPLTAAALAKHQAKLRAEFMASQRHIEALLERQRILKIRDDNQQRRSK